MVRIQSCTFIPAVLSSFHDTQSQNHIGQFHIQSLLYAKAVGQMPGHYTAATFTQFQVKHHILKPFNVITKLKLDEGF